MSSIHHLTALLFLPFFLNNFFFLLGYSCFTMLCQFLLYDEVNQLSVYIYPLPLGSPSLPPPPIQPIQVITEHQAELPVLYSRFPQAICFTYGSVFMSVPISQFIPPSFPHSISTYPHLLLQRYLFSQLPIFLRVPFQPMWSTPHSLLILPILISC